MNADPTHSLTPAQRDAVFDTQIVPAWTKGAVAQQHPVAVVIIGQSGSGKSFVAAMVKSSLDRRGGAVHAASDDFKALHPGYRALLHEDEQSAGIRVRADVRAWQQRLEEFARTSGFDVVVESAPTPEELAATARAYRLTGYRIEIVVVAAPPAWSQLGVVERFLIQAQVEGAGRYVGWDNHDQRIRDLVASVRAVETAVAVDHITVVDGAGRLLYRNEQTPDGRWLLPAGAADAVAREHTRPWTAAETWAFRRRMATTSQLLMSPSSAPERRLAVDAAVERAFALAERQRRTAQVRVGDPGVNYHRLSPDEHAWYFEELIAPDVLEQVAPQERPVVVYVMGQPGAGKGDIAAMVLRALAARGGATHISAEHLKAAHPDYHDLSRSNPRTAGSLIRPDVKAWQGQLEAAVRALRGDVVIEIAPGDAAEFLDSATRFHDAGYDVEVIALAVRAADSRQGTAARAASLMGEAESAVRFTTVAGHDRCYDAVAAVVEIAEQHRAIDALHLVRRGGDLLWHNERLADGRRLHAARACWVLAAERERPYTDVEALAFLAGQRLLRAVLPQYRDDLDQIDALGRPLLPEQLRPKRLDQTEGRRFLPLPRGGYSPESSL